MSIRVLLAGDQALVRAGFRLILGTEDDMTVVGEAHDGEQAVRLVEDLQPDLVLMDIRMPILDGLQATRRVVRLPRSPARVLVLTTFERDDYIFEALRAGASGFLLTNCPPEDLVQAVRLIARGDALLAPSVTRRVIERYVAGGRSPTATSTALQRLTQRELEVLRLLARGMSNTELARDLYVGEGTVRTHVSSILTELHLPDRALSLDAAQGGRTHRRRELSRDGVSKPGTGIGSAVAASPRTAGSTAERRRRAPPLCTELVGQDCTSSIDGRHGRAARSTARGTRSRRRRGTCSSVVSTGPVPTTFPEGSDPGVVGNHASPATPRAGHSAIRSARVCGGVPRALGCVPPACPAG